MNPGLLKVHRREFLKTCAAAAASSVLPVYGLLESTAATASPAPQPAGKSSPRSAVKDVSPAIGTGWHGHMFPGATAPFGLVQLSPDSAGLPNRMRAGQRDNYGWDHSSGYHNTDNVIVGFSHTHVQGTGGADLGDVLVMPLVEGRNWGWEPNIPTDQGEAQIEALGLSSGWVFNGPNPGYCSFFSHEKEVMRAGFYGVHLQTPDVEAELAATTRCGMHRYRYPVLPAHTRTGVIIDFAHSLGSKVYQGELNIESNVRVTGRRGTHGWADDKQVYFVIEFARPFASIEVSVDGKTASAAAGDKLSGKEIKAIFTQQPGAAPLIMRVGLSCTGIEGAAKNLSAEIPHWDFDAVVRQSEQAWSRELAPLDAELPTKALSQTFFTGAYHGLTSPVTFNDVDGTYRGQDRQNHPNPGFTKYTILSIWDIYRGEFPFIMLMQPKRATDIVRTLLADYKELNQNSLPMWTLWGNETWSMVGFHAAGMIVSAYVRGLRDFDAEAAYAAIRDTALVGATAKGNRELQAAFRTMGYVPVEQMHEGAACCTLDLSYDYWCAGAMAELLGKHDDAAMFYKLGQNYKNVFDPGTGFVRGKLRNGKWREPFRPDQEYLDYVETDAWQASFSVPHDVQGLIDLYGGDAQFIAKLDGLFTAPSNVIDARPDVSGMVGQDAQGNEPSNHTPYLYSFAGAPWKTQYWVRKVAALYNNTPQGIPGNDDCGQLSSWFVFAALGFYPVNAVTGVYVIGSPIVCRAALRNPVTGAKFTIVADNNSPENVFIQSVQLNGKDLTRSWITHAQIVAGGELHFRMGSKPNKQWGSAPADRPPSGLLHS
jgi:predicted alpha-1,2-mannosidase